MCVHGRRVHLDAPAFTLLGLHFRTGQPCGLDPITSEYETKGTIERKALDLINEHNHHRLSIVQKGISLSKQNKSKKKTKHNNVNIHGKHI